MMMILFDLQKSFQAFAFRILLIHKVSAIQNYYSMNLRDAQILLYLEYDCYFDFLDSHLLEFQKELHLWHLAQLEDLFVKYF
jgi:hypothetical protein